MVMVRVGAVVVVLIVVVRVVLLVVKVVVTVVRPGAEEVGLDEGTDRSSESQRRGW